MKRLFLVPLIVTAFFNASAQEKPGRVFNGGAAKINITPPLGMEIVGNFAPRPIAAHVHDELHARCLVVDDGETKLAFVVADTISLARDVWNAETADWVPLKAAAADLELAVRRPTPEMIAWAKGVLAKPKDAAELHCLEKPCAEKVLSAHDAMPDTVSCVMQAFRIGDLGIAAIPFEVFMEIGLEIKTKRPFGETFTIELANGSNGYLPTPPQHDLGGYETWLGTNRVEREASVKITAKVLELPGSVK